MLSLRGGSRGKRTFFVRGRRRKCRSKLLVFDNDSFELQDCKSEASDERPQSETKGSSSIGDNGALGQIASRNPGVSYVDLCRFKLMPIVFMAPLVHQLQHSIEVLGENLEQKENYWQCYASIENRNIVFRQRRSQGRRSEGQHWQRGTYRYMVMIISGDDHIIDDMFFEEYAC